MRNTFIREIEKHAAADPLLYVISGDAGFGVFEEFKSRFPGQFINAGIAEANTVGYAAGLALAGYNVFVYNIIPFVLYRCYEQVRNDICYQRLPVTLVGIGSGLTYAPGGMTHYSVEDLALCQSLPNLTVISPADPVETQAAISHAYGANTPVYIRLAKSGEPVIRNLGCADILSPAVITEGDTAALIGYGPILIEAVEALERVKTDGITPRLISMPTIWPFPGERVLEMLEGCQRIYILEEHFRSGGLATRMADHLATAGMQKRVVSLSIPDRFIHAINNQQGMRERFSLDAASIADRLRLDYLERSSGYAV